MEDEKVTLPVITKEVHRLDPQLKESEDSFKTAVLMLSALSVGTEVDALVKFTRLPESFVAERVGRLKAGGVFKGDEIHVDWFDEENGGIAFWMDVAVAQGLVERTDDAEYVQEQWPDVIGEQ